MKIFATITEKDSPSAGFYRARTCFGQNISGVSLKGPNFPLAEKQQVAVFEVGGAFGSFAVMGEYPSLLTVPGEIKPGFCKQAPAKASLAYLAYHVKNIKTWYAVGTVTGISGDSLIVDGKIIPTKGVSAADFSNGEHVLIDKRDRGAAVIGWWNTVPTSGLLGPKCLVVGRVQYSSRVYMRLIQSVGGSIIKLNEVIFNQQFSPQANSAFITTSNTVDSDDYLYSFVQFGINFSVILEEYWVRWHKTSFTVEILTSPGPAYPYNKTSDDKFWWFDPSIDPLYAYQSDDFAGERKKVMFVDSDFASQDRFFPAKGEVYTPI